jgi:putative chitinase
MNRNVFFEYVRNAPFGGRLTQSQVDGLTKILDEWDRRGFDDDRWLAYMLSTVFWETAKTMQPIYEKGNKAYFNKYDGRRDLGNVKPGDGFKYRGRGLVQITGYTNYAKYSIHNDPDKALSWPVALEILFEGMVNGAFTGKKLGHYFNDKVDDPVNARRIINGTDKAKLLAGFHKNFLDAIEAAKKAEPAVKAEPVPTEDVKVTEDKGALGTVITAAGGLGGIGAFASIDSPYALAAFALVLVAVGIGIYAYTSGKIVIKR